ncbi:hypothetical protein ASG17_07540 [Brevundimonas sp. Leaf363]|uniref:hypothetical protein n=1 Tax=Brevundimonas sp. Leaf363 TaxID=1736353 RepID=UPI0006FB05F6|nr:hypothetical protein [Brevundimonas sp. Leaf363]KQS55894.1 hypothetical protein ASG17_07540 [Brevundimonas sp. Leaf363]
MGKALATVGTAIVIGGLALATAGASLIPTLAGGGLTGAFGTAAFGITAGQYVTAGLALNLVGSTMSGMATGQGRQPTDWVASNDTPLPFPAGRVGMAGKINYRVAYGPNNQYQSIVATLARSGPIQGIVSTAFNDVVTTFGSDEKATNGPHSGWMWLQTTLGTQPETALTSPSGLTSGATIPDWTSAYKMSGAAAYMLTLSENSKLSEFEGNEEKPLIILDGLRGWDPRIDSTWPGGAGTCRLNNPATWVLMSNGAIYGLNWSIGRWEGDSGGGLYGVPYQSSLVGGIGSSLDGIDVGAFVYAANVADANGWKMAGVPDSSMDESTVLDQALQAAGAYRSRVAGKISCVSRGAEQASLLTITPADTAGEVELSLGPSRLDRKNSGTAYFLSGAHTWGDLTPIDPIGNAAWVTQDRGSERPTRGDYPYVPDKNQAAQLIYYDLADRRERLSGTVPLKAYMRRIKPGDCFTFDAPGFQLDGVKAKCLQRNFDPMTAVVRITFREETDAKHDAAMAQVGVTSPVPGSTAPPSAFINAPAIYTPTVSSGTVTLTVRAPSDLSFDYIEVRRSVNSTTMPGTNLVPPIMGAPSQTFTVTDTPGSGVIRYWARAVSDTGAQSAWVQTGVTV